MNTMCFDLNYINLKRNSASDGSFDVNTSVRGIGEVKMTSTNCCIPFVDDHLLCWYLSISNVIYCLLLLSYVKQVF